MLKNVYLNAYNDFDTVENARLSKLGGAPDADHQFQNLLASNQFSLAPEVEPV